ncbi:hypothetical protein [Streptomyces bauhiniae]
MTERTVFAGYVPFPEPPGLIEDYVAARSAGEEDGPPPWEIGALSPELLAPLPARLDRVCRWLNQTYAWQSRGVIPPCWKEHHHLPYEIAAFAFARLDAYADAGSTVVWHEQYERFVTRMNNTLGRSADACRAGKHDDRPAGFALAAWSPPTTDEPMETQNAES